MAAQDRPCAGRGGVVSCQPRMRIELQKQARGWVRNWWTDLTERSVAQVVQTISMESPGLPRPKTRAVVAVALAELAREYVWYARRRRSGNRCLACAFRVLPVVAGAAAALLRHHARESSTSVMVAISDDFRRGCRSASCAREGEQRRRRRVADAVLSLPTDRTRSGVAELHGRGVLRCTYDVGYAVCALERGSCTVRELAREIDRSYDQLTPRLPRVFPPS